MRRWLRDPSGAIAVLSFIPTDVGNRTSTGSDRRERVRHIVADRR
jgi:hypothetical protein